MLNPFATMWLSVFAYFILRIIVAFTLLRLGYTHLRYQTALSEAFTQAGAWFPKISTQVLIATEIILAFLILLGYHTQYACLVLMALSLKMMVFSPRLKIPIVPSRYYYLLLFGCAISLFITGAGIFAFDLPI